MAPITYYFCLSIGFLFASILHVVNMIYFRVKGGTIFDQVKYRPGTDEYRRLSKFASNKGLALAIILMIVLAVNLPIAIRKFLSVASV